MPLLAQLRPTVSNITSCSVGARSLGYVFMQLINEQSVFKVHYMCVCLIIVIVKLLKLNDMNILL